MNWEHYASRANRDARYRELVRNGYPGVRRRSSRGQLIHPEYVVDADPVAQADNGFGNTRYKTYFAVLYTVEWDDRPVPPYR